MPQEIHGEYIFRHHNEFYYTIPPLQPVALSSYTWDKKLVGTFPLITKEHFRCRGNPLNPIKHRDGVAYEDCGGAELHSLPLQVGEEFVYPILCDLLNYLQAKTEKKVIITSGHHCPKHHLYLDPSPKQQASKHLVGAEVNFYVQGLESQPYKIIQLLQEYYPDKKFERYEGNTNVSTPPWMNREIFIKLFSATEGRNEDNRHGYPYISIQVRWNRDIKERVVYTWKQSQNFYRK